MRSKIRLGMAAGMSVGEQDERRGMKIWNEKEGRINGWTAAGSVLLIAIVFLSIVWVVTFFSFGIRVATAGLVGRGEARIQIQSAGSRIANYELFFNRCAAVKSAEDRIDALEVELALYELGSSDFARTATNLTGVRSQRQQSVNDYNADALKDYTRGQFRDSDLPYQLDDRAYPEGGKTTCATQ